MPAASGLGDAGVLTAEEFLSRGQLIEIRDAIDSVHAARSYTHVPVNADPYLKLALTALEMAVEKIEGSGQ